MIARLSSRWFGARLSLSFSLPLLTPGIRHGSLATHFRQCRVLRPLHGVLWPSQVEVYNETIRDLLAEPRSKAELSAPGTFRRAPFPLRPGAVWC